MSHYQGKFDTNHPTVTHGKFLTMFQCKLLQKSLQQDLPELYRQRIQIMLLVDEGKSQTEICRTLGCSPATARHWTHIARTGMAHQWQDCPIGRPMAVNDEYLQRLQQLVNDSPRDYGYSFQRWTANWLRKHLAKEFGVEISDRHILRLLKQMGLSTKPQPKNADKDTDKSDFAKSSKILIRDLNSANPPDSTELLPLNLTKLGTDSDIYGAQSNTSALAFSTTVEQCSRISSF
ncbi:MAG: helix-turn-helix domain-containing protein [Brasilonema octagenarum HA4186-MV1]|jgi:transposase|uniref:Helix-turn-helix domain-containing protein n=2 Tax=Brasilonema TaxID=383614 RepID=A0A856M958_9CYAN|nr:MULTISPECIES: helix-turn-helix domain-containing protein [Brasilonema]MBW4625985.1 helix-turn-helix domain-containing protein [Brasilonema octagenarum HA4186-MV1]NMF62020.1 helix-turn-helix domain-containing protein [Brasilonema octagenarum UFV-OR1]QDL07298.1 helix-turn-helix domain-containing protein [Brasilonema sennae CENA114]QDL13662.1 helix-turn-helix domain-containing protein [Brasilonema octagenarum UFV-E1]